MTVSTSRKYYRACIPALPAAELQFGGHLLGGILIDVSRTGVLLNAGHAELYQLQAPCRMHLSGVPDFFGGIIVYSDEQIVGIKFIGLKQAQLEDIERLIMASSGNPQLLDRDIPNMVSDCLHSAFLQH